MRTLCLAAVAALTFTVPASADGVPAPDDAFVGSIRTTLSPGEDDAYSDAEYTGAIYRIEAPQRATIAAQTAYDPAETLQFIPVVMNYNHSMDFDVDFGAGSWEINPAAMVALDALGAALNSAELSPYTYVVGGHTDTSGELEFNQWLSERRAEEVRAYLIEQYEVAPDRLVAVGFGEEALADAKDGESAANRRIEVTLVESDWELRVATAAKRPVVAAAAAVDTPPAPAFRVRFDGPPAVVTHRVVRTVTTRHQYALAPYAVAYAVPVQWNDGGHYRRRTPPFVGHVVVPRQYPRHARPYGAARYGETPAYRGHHHGYAGRQPTRTHHYGGGYRAPHGYRLTPAGAAAVINHAIAH